MVPTAAQRVLLYLRAELGRSTLSMEQNKTSVPSNLLGTKQCAPTPACPIHLLRTSSALPPSPSTGGLRAGFPFELRKQDGSYVTARAVVEGATVTLTPESESAIESGLDYGGSAGTFVGFRYAWHPFPLCVLTNGNGLPAAPIEQYDSDSWE